MRAMAPGSRRWRPLPAVLLGYLALSAAATWPLLARFGREIGGDRGDAWQTLWGFWWWKESLFRLGTTPMLCPLLHHPHGVPLWFQTWDLPSLLATLPLWAVPGLPEVSVYNAAIFAAYPLSGLTLCLLCRELWGGWLGPFLAGALYTVSAYHFGHALGHLHVVSMEWSPLYFLGLWRTVRRPGWAAPAGAGLALSAAALASFYHLLLCLVGTLVLAGFWLRSDRAALLSRPFAGRAAVLLATFAALTGWLYAGMLRAYLSEPYAGAHDPGWFSADLLSFFLPNAASAWAGRFPAWRAWTGNAAESAGYLGYALLGLALAAGTRLRAARPWLGLALVGVLLALGPRLHVAGRIHGGFLLPYGWLERAIPILAFAGVPARFSWLATFGLAVAAGGALSALERRGPRGAALAVALAALGLLESWPHAFATSGWPAPAFLRRLADDPRPWAVLDASDPLRQLWHQVLHRHRQLGGYVSRPPVRLEAWLEEEPELRPFFARPPPSAPWPPRRESLALLRELRVRFVVVERDRLEAARALDLPLAFAGDGLWIYEVAEGPP